MKPDDSLLVTMMYGMTERTDRAAGINTGGLRDPVNSEESRRRQSETAERVEAVHADEFTIKEVIDDGN